MAELEQEKRGRRRRRGREEEVVEAVEEKGLTAKKGKATVGRRNTAEVQSGNALTRPFIGFGNYLVGVQEEMKKVTWPTREETIRLSRVVIIVTIIAALFFGLLSLALTELFAIGIENPIAFVVFGVVMAGVVFGYRVWSSRQQNQL